LACEFRVELVDGLDVFADELEAASFLNVDAGRDQHVRKDQIRERGAIAEAHRYDLVR
jgi:hypothetical protein